MIGRRKGFIIIFALIMVGLVMLLTEQLVRGVFVSSSYVKAMLAREQARLGVTSGMEIARAKLTQLYLLLEKKKPGQKKNQTEQQANPSDDPNQQTPDDDQGEGADPNKKAQTGQQKFITQILPLLNRWQTIELKEETDGVAMEIRLCFMCEQGKININEAFDFKKQEFKKDYANYLKTLEVSGATKLSGQELLQTLQEFFTKRRRKLQDISELAEIPALSALRLFYEPPAAVLPGQKLGGGPNKALALGDIFTVWTENALLDPLMLSDALCMMLTFRQPQADDAEKMQDRYQKFAEQYKPSMAQNLEKNWETFQLIYDQKQVSLQDIQALFSKEFGPSVYSVLCYATVAGVTQRALGIVKKRKKEVKPKKGQQTQQAQAQQSQDDQKKSSAPMWEFRLERLYWI